jgi:hypothetical protein
LPGAFPHSIPRKSRGNHIAEIPAIKEFYIESQTRKRNYRTEPVDYVENRRRRNPSTRRFVTFRRAWAAQAELDTDEFDDWENATEPNGDGEPENERRKTKRSDLGNEVCRT